MEQVRALLALHSAITLSTTSTSDRIEMHLVPDVEQRVWLDVLAFKVTVAPGETIRSEISCKFTRDTAQTMLKEAGLRLERWYTDAEGLFGLALATRG